MSKLVCVNEILRGMLPPLEGTVQGEAVAFALKVLEEQSAALAETDRLRAEIDRLTALIPSWQTAGVGAHTLPDYDEPVLLIFDGESEITFARRIRTRAENGMWSYTGSDGRIAEAHIQRYDRWMRVSEVQA